MSIETLIVTAAQGASLAIYPEGEVPENAKLPFTTYRRTLLDPVMTLAGPEGTIHSEYLFASWGRKSEGAGATTAKASAIATANAFDAAIQAATAITCRFRLPVAGEDFDDETLLLMEPRRWSFWHT